MINLDRFSRELDGETRSSFTHQLQDLQERQKIEIVRRYIDSYVHHTQQLPESYMVSETYDAIYLDDTMIQHEINQFNKEWKR